MEGLGRFREWGFSGARQRFCLGRSACQRCNFRHRPNVAALGSSSGRSLYDARAAPLIRMGICPKRFGLQRVKLGTSSHGANTIYMVHSYTASITPSVELVSCGQHRARAAFS